MSQDYPRGESTAGENTDSDRGFTFQNYYDLLGVRPDADTDTILDRYRSLVKKHHPDTSSLPEQEAERRFEQLVQARKILENPQKREAYDQLGHDAYLEQSKELGRHVRGSDSSDGGHSGDTGADGDSDSNDRPTGTQSSSAEPQPQPATTGGAEDTASQAHGRETQTTARGEALKRGEAIPGTPDKVFAERTGTASEPEPDEAGERSAYHSLFTLDQELSTTSVYSIGEHWGNSWRSRFLLTVGILIGVLGSYAVLPVVADSAGLSLSLPAVSVGWFFAITAVVGLATTVRTCLRAEITLPQGGFVDDRELDRFTFANARRYRTRGYFYLAVPVVLLVTSTRTEGQHPWEYTATAIQGDGGAVFPWFPLEVLGLGSYQTVLNVVLTFLFALGAVVGAMYISLGISITVWRRRFETGDPFRPSVWEPVLSGALISIGAALLVGTYPLLSIPGVNQLPTGILAFFAVSEGQLTIGSLAGVGMILLLVLPLWYRLRLRMVSSEAS